MDMGDDKSPRRSRRFEAFGSRAREKEEHVQNRGILAKLEILDSYSAQEDVSGVGGAR